MEVISRIQHEILSNFGTIPDSQEFYFTGGTALSLFYIEHRRSNDLDFFTTNPELVTVFSYNLEENLKRSGMVTQRQRGVRSFVEIVAEKEQESTIIHIAQETPFRLDKLREFAQYPGLKVDSLQDIASNKLLALFGRATLRDFIDVYFLCKKKDFLPEELISRARAKDPGFDLYWLGVAFERINTFKPDSADMLLLIEPVDFHELVGFFNQWRQKIASQLL